MENCSNGSSNCSEQREVQALGFGVSCVLLTVLMVAVCALMILTIASLCKMHSMAKVLRIHLINILVAGLLMGGTFILATLSSATLAFTNAETPPLLFCRFVVLTFSVGSIVRPLNVASFSIVVLLIVRFGKKDWKALYSGVSVAALWIAALVVNVFVLVPPVFHAQYIQGLACFPDASRGVREVQLVYSCVSIGLGTVAPLVVCVVIPAYVLYYIKGHTVTGDSDYDKGIVRLALFLVTGNLIHLAGGLLTVTGAYFSTFVSVYFLYIFSLLSLVPIPILIIIFLKSVRDEMKAIVTCKCRPSSSKVHPIVQNK